jgi:hypothetical protein
MAGGSCLLEHRNLGTSELQQTDDSTMGLDNEHVLVLLNTGAEYGNLASDQFVVGKINTKSARHLLMQLSRSIGKSRNRNREIRISGITSLASGCQYAMSAAAWVLCPPALLFLSQNVLS